MGESPAGTLVASRHSLDVAVSGFNPGVRLNVFLTQDPGTNRLQAHVVGSILVGADGTGRLLLEGMDLSRAFAMYSPTYVSASGSVICQTDGPCSVVRLQAVRVHFADPVDSFTSAFDVDGVSGPLTFTGVTLPDPLPATPLPPADPRIAELEQELSEAQARIDVLEAGLQAAQGLIPTAAQAERDAAVADRNAAEAALATVQAELLTAQARVGVLEAELTQTRADLSGAQTALATAQADLQAAQAALAAARAERDVARARVTELEGTLAETQLALSRAQARITGLEADLSQARADLTAAQARIAALEAQLARARADLAVAQARIGVLEAELALVRLNLTRRDADLGVAQARIRELEAALAAAQQSPGGDAAIRVGLSAVEQRLKAAFRDPAFVIPGSTPQQRYDAFIQAILTLNQGRTQGLYDALR